MSNLRVYFDACALNRLNDDQSQARVRIEAEAVEEVFLLILIGGVEWVASKTLELELSRNSDETKRGKALGLLVYAGALAVPHALIRLRAERLGAAGYGALDAFHLAHAEEARVDALLTTDDRFVSKARRRVANPTVRVVNPVDWLQEVRKWLPSK